MKFNVLCAFTVLLAAPAAFADELSTTGEFLDGIAAVVNEGVVLKRLILTEIQLQRAERIGLRISDEMLNQSIAAIAAQNGVSFEDMPALLANDGLDYTTFRRTLREEITVSQLRRIEVSQSINVSEREIEQCIADLEGNVVANSEYELSHILLPLPEGASADEIAEVEALANQVYAQISNGADFREMAVRYSKGPTALEGGSLGAVYGRAPGHGNGRRIAAVARFQQLSHCQG